MYALVGSSGTGKSHRAIMLANKLGCEVIIDDGLIISGSRIIAGISAKKQPTRIGAIKTALFMDTQHMETAKETIAFLKPYKILIIGTSIGMVEKIAKRIGLPGDMEIIDINKIATEKEIRKARIMRMQHSKHVIPAPTVEVKRSLPEIVIDPLQIFFKRKGQKSSRSWLEQSVVRPTFTMYGKLVISQNALAIIATYAAIAIPDVIEVKHTSIIKDELGVAIELDVVINIKLKLNDISREIQICVKEQVEKMTALTIKYVNVTVSDILTRKAR